MIHALLSVALGIAGVFFALFTVVLLCGMVAVGVGEAITSPLALSTGLLLVAWISILVIKYVMDVSPLYNAINVDIASGVLKLHYISGYRAEFVSSNGVQIWITTSDDNLPDLDFLGAVIFIGKYREERMPIGSFAAYLLFKRATRLTHGAETRRSDLEYVKRWRGTDEKTE